VRRYTVSDGIVIRRKPLPSGDVVVTLMSQDGKWRAVARKGRLPGGNIGKLSLFHDVTVQYYRRHDEDLALLTQVQLNGALPRLASPEVYPYANLLAELVDALTVDVHLGERLYEHLASGLRGLNRHDDPEHIGLLYAWRLIGIAGLAPRLEGCVGCGRRDDLAALDVSAGGLACRECASGLPLDGEAITELRLLVAAPARAALDCPPRQRPLHWRLLSRYVSYHARDLLSLEPLTRSGGSQASEAPVGSAGSA